MILRTEILFVGFITIATTWERPADIPEEWNAEGHALRLRVQP